MHFFRYKQTTLPVLKSTVSLSTANEIFSITQQVDEETTKELVRETTSVTPTAKEIEKVSTAEVVKSRKKSKKHNKHGKAVSIRTTKQTSRNSFIPTTVESTTFTSITSIENLQPTTRPITHKAPPPPRKKPNRRNKKKKTQHRKNRRQQSRIQDDQPVIDKNFIVKSSPKKSNPERNNDELIDERQNAANNANGIHIQEQALSMELYDQSFDSCIRIPNSDCASLLPYSFTAYKQADINTPLLKNLMRLLQIEVPTRPLGDVIPKRANKRMAEKVDPKDKVKRSAIVFTCRVAYPPCDDSEFTKFGLKNISREFYSLTWK